MSLTKQAKMLSPDQIVSVEAFLESRHDPLRDTTILYLAVYAGLRACEIAALDWTMLVDAAGNLSSGMAITNAASKGNTGGRVVPIHPKLATVLRELRQSHNVPPRKGRVIVSRNGTAGVSPHYIVKRMKQWFAACGLDGCSSHSGRRTFITTAARTINLHGGSLRDVQALAGHAFITTTERYIEQNEAAKASVVGAM